MAGKTVCVAVDLHQATEATVEWVAQHALPPGGKLTVLTVQPGAAGAGAAHPPPVRAPPAACCLEEESGAHVADTSSCCSAHPPTPLPALGGHPVHSGKGQAGLPGAVPQGAGAGCDRTACCC